MFSVKTPMQATEIISNHFSGLFSSKEKVPLIESCKRVLCEDIYSNEFVPHFDRSMVDGYAVSASDTFGCSEAIPAIVDFMGEIEMGENPTFEIKKGQCAYVPTGGQIPLGANAMVMIEYAEDFQDGTIALMKPSAPGQSLIYKGDDVKEGQLVLKKGHLLRPNDIGTLAALGYCEVPVFKKPKIAVISTGDELIAVEKPITGAKIRDVNTYMLCSAIAQAGADYVSYGIVIDDYEVLKEIVEKASNECDIVLISGGSSVGTKDAAAKVIACLGEILFHGIALKPGKPTILGDIFGKPVFGLPGHPVAAYLVYEIFARPLVDIMMGCHNSQRIQRAFLSQAIPSNHGREECVSVSLVQKCDSFEAQPIMGKSGLITLLSNSSGYIRIPRDCEGLKKGDEVSVIIF